MNAENGGAKMRANVGGVDREIRIVLGLALLALGFGHVVTGTWGAVAYTLGAVALVTGLLRFCPAWSVSGINSCEAKTSQGK
jgi:Inner membrane protein YgaP-like, transmembrane domain